MKNKNNQRWRFNKWNSFVVKPEHPRTDVTKLAVAGSNLVKLACRIVRGVIQPMRTMRENVQALELPWRISGYNLSCCGYFIYKGRNQRRDDVFYRKLSVTNQDMFWTRVPVFVLPLNQGLWNVSSLMWTLYQELPFSSVIWKEEDSLSEDAEEDFCQCRKSEFCSKNNWTRRVAHF